MKRASEVGNVESCRVSVQARRVRRAFLSSNVAARTMPWAPVRRGGIQRACKVWWVSAAGSPCSDRHRRNRDGGWHNGAAADRAAMVYRVWRQDEAARHPTQQPTAVVNQNQQGDATAPSTEPDHYYSNNMSRPPNPAHTSHSLSHTHTRAPRAGARLPIDRRHSDSAPLLASPADQTPASNSP